MALITQQRGSLGRWWSLICIGLFLLLREARGEVNNETSPTHIFKSRPDLHAPMIDILLLQPDLVEPGYIFIAPYRNLDPGPYIYDNQGELVWSGAGWSGPRVAHTPRVCQYHGEDHLCFFTGEQHQGFSRGHGVIMDKHYRTVRTIEAHGAGATSDMHEFKMAPYADGKSVLMTVYQPRQYDLTTNPRFNVKDGMGWIVEGVFQEIEIDTNKLLFEWRSLDHVDPGDAWTTPHSTDTSGNGWQEWHPWDYFHLNSIDKNKEGDYLISARHCSAIYKLSGKDGSIIWTLGGVKSDFETTNFNFAYQHHARWLSETAEKTVISMFNNGFNGYNETTDLSHGFIIEIDHVTKKATMTRKWGAPDIVGGGLRSASQGSMQLLPGGNVHIGWGDHARYSEHTWDGTPAMYARLAKDPSGVPSYRSNKYNWTAQPLTKPALWTYSKEGAATNDQKMAFWASWNGATEVASWNFFTADSATGPWNFVASEEKRGFETVHHSRSFSQWAYAQALDKSGKVLEDSVISRTFVPSEKLRPFCGDEGCRQAEPIKLEDEDFTPYEMPNEVGQETLSTGRGFDTTGYYHGFDGGGHEADRPDGEEDGGNASIEPSTPDVLPSGGNRNEYHFSAPGPMLDGNPKGGIGSSNIVVLLIGVVTGFFASFCFNFVRGRGYRRVQTYEP
ncbi:uncharacterized protein LTR77_000765 [Saxophila tyrrhenica]|uniref:ASST-domain-containing protein n=1 Tax=Saxophila tyrrhenica TaxID=1690608 RepID=A0AAV9PPG4_9PEZI|nr:hypothetical protein LTR77_000765 [Saxophila tyrrhenica]